MEKSWQLPSYTTIPSPINFMHMQTQSIISKGYPSLQFSNCPYQVINNYARQNDLLKEKELFTGDDVREGLTAVISVKVPEPRFEGQTKTKLSNREVDGIVQKIVGEKMKHHFEINPDQAKAIIEL